jgi:hypothetical protein
VLILGDSKVVAKQLWVMVLVVVSLCCGKQVQKNLICD